VKTRPVFVALLTGVALYTGFLLLAQDVAHRLREKVAQAESRVKSLASQGGDPSAALALMQQVKPALDAGDPTKAEALLDRARKILDEPANASPLPVYTAKEPDSDLYGNATPVVISGYDGSAMEPFISPDGRLLFFNNENDPNVNTNLHFAERTGKLSFRYRGELPGVNSPVLDAVASIDTAGHFYFTTLRDYARSMNSIYTGDFEGEVVRNVRPVPGDISPKAPGAINMDVSVSPDGETFYISRAVIIPGAPAPKKSELLVARLKGGAFRIEADSDRITRNINTGALNYAPCISADGLELYFTRASQPAGPRILVSTRASVNDPFSEPRVLTALAGFVEAPSISLDRKELFFHKKVGDRFAIYRAARRPETPNSGATNRGPR
jgi:WD40-like Beta Propeller Repeat